MRQNKPRGFSFVLTLLASLMVSSNSWLWATPAGLTQTEASQLSIADGKYTSREFLDQTVAKELLEQLQTAVDDIQDNKYKTYALLEIAHSYSKLSDETTATELLYEVLNIADETARALNTTDEFSEAAQLSALLKGIRLFSSDEAVIYDLFNQVLTRVTALDDLELQAPLLAEISSYGNELFSDAALADALDAQVMEIVNQMPVGDAKFQALRGLAIGYHQVSNDTTAVKLLGQSLDVLSQIDNDELKMTVLFMLNEFIDRLNNEAIDETLLTRVLAITDTLANDVNKAYEWANSLTLAEQTTNPATVKDLLNQSLKVANDLADDTERYLLLLIIANSYGQLSDHHHYQEFPQQLFEAVNQIQDVDNRHYALIDVVKAVVSGAENMGSAESLEQVFAVANTLEDSWSKAHILILTASGQVDQVMAQALLEQALDIIDVESYNYSHTQVLRDFVIASKRLPDENRQQLLDHYLAVINQIQDKEALSYLLFAMANEYGKGYESTANVLIGMALSTVEKMSDNMMAASVLHRNLDELTSLSLETDKVVDEINTFNLLQQILAYTDGLEEPIADTGFWVSFAHRVLKLSNEAHVNALLAELLSRSTASENPSFKMNVSLAIAEIYASLADETAAKVWLDRALTAGRQIDHEGGRMATMSGMVQVTNVLSDSMAVETWLDDWLTMTKGMQHSHMQSSGLNIIADASGRLADKATVRMLVKEMVAIAATIEDDLHRADALGSIAESVATMATGEPI